MSEEITALAGVLAALSVGVVSPGPSFVMVLRTAVASSRPQAVGAALGMGVGGLCFAAAALLGLQGVFQAVPALYLVLKALGGAYLCYLGWRIFGAAAQPLAVEASGTEPARPGRSFWLGLTTQLSNPKTAIVYASVFATFLPREVSPGFAAALLLLVFFIEAGWYTLVAVVLSAPAPQKVYVSSKAWVDRLAGAVMAGLGVNLIGSAVDA